jgi:outer membrane protein assembly factor BamA
VFDPTRKHTSFFPFAEMASPPLSSPREVQAQQQRRRLQELRQEQLRLQAQLALQRFAAGYEFELAWPPSIVHTGTSSVRTNHELIQYRLIEAGVLTDIPVTTADTVEAAGRFIADLERTDCFQSVQVELGGTAAERPQAEEEGEMARTLMVKLREKNWYRLHAGAGLKTDGFLTGQQEQQPPDSFLPTADVEISAGLRNLTGNLDKTEVQYTLDTKSVASWSLSHSRPLFSVLPEAAANSLLETVRGSQHMFTGRAALDTVDHEWTRSYKEFQRILSMTIANHNLPITSALAVMESQLYWNLEWAIKYRDLVPSRHAAHPYHLTASPEIVSAAGPNVKHSLSAAASWQSEAIDHPLLPSSGTQVQASAEMATPPGDVGFVKGQAVAATHWPVTSLLSLHGYVSAGYLKSLSFSGLCRPASISDRFFVGGPGNFRGFLPAGMGPRTVPTGSDKNKRRHGDALGGDCFYTVTAMASTAIPEAAATALPLVAPHIRLFCFGTAGTCANLASCSPLDLFRSTRLSVGVGLATAALGPRLEFTYAVPVRYGPLDGRRRFQFGISFSVG